MMKFFVFLFALCVLVSGCATTSPYCKIPQAKSATDEVTLVIYRPDAFYGILYSTPFSIDGCRVNDLANDSYHVYKIPTGNHTIAAEVKAFSSGGEAVIQGVFEKGKTYYLHYAMSPGNFYSVGGVSGFTTSTQFAVVTKEFALATLPKLADLKK